MDLRNVARVQAAGRVLVGAALLIAPKAAGAGWIGDAAGEKPTGVYSRALGIRDLVMGVAVLATLHDRQQARPWLLAGIAADTVDLAATLVARAELPGMGQTVAPAVAGGSAALGAAVLAALERE